MVTPGLGEQTWWPCGASWGHGGSERDFRVQPSVYVRVTAPHTAGTLTAVGQPSERGDRVQSHPAISGTSVSLHCDLSPSPQQR